MPVRLARRWLLLALTLVASGCLSTPTLPLPPPEPEEPTVPEGGWTRLTGHVPASDVTVRVFALNERTNLLFGELINTSAFDFLVEARSGDFLTVWYEVGSRQSTPVVLEVPEPEGAPPPSAPDASSADAGP